MPKSTAPGDPIGEELVLGTYLYRSCHRIIDHRPTLSFDIKRRAWSTTPGLVWARWMELFTVLYAPRRPTFEPPVAC